MNQIQALIIIKCLYRILRIYSSRFFSNSSNNYLIKTHSNKFSKVRLMHLSTDNMDNNYNKYKRAIIYRLWILRVKIILHIKTILKGNLIKI